jgi:hypothetical protein
VVGALQDYISTITRSTYLALLEALLDDWSFIQLDQVVLQSTLSPSQPMASWEMPLEFNHHMEHATHLVWQKAPQIVLSLAHCIITCESVCDEALSPRPWSMASHLRSGSAAQCFRPRTGSNTRGHQHNLWMQPRLLRRYYHVNGASHLGSTYAVKSVCALTESNTRSHQHYLWRHEFKQRDGVITSTARSISPRIHLCRAFFWPLIDHRVKHQTTSAPSASSQI